MVIHGQTPVLFGETLGGLPDYHNVTNGLYKMQWERDIHLAAETQVSLRESHC